jgi:predicted RNA-binding Zn ribbon-like protein
VGRGELRRLVELRSVLRALLDANLRGDQDRTAAAKLARLAAAHPISLTGGDTGELVLDLTPAASIGELISQMIGIVFEAQREAYRPRLKVCASDQCRWAFFDASRNRGGTWCQMEVCGNRIKNRAYRRRRRDASGWPN